MGEAVPPAAMAADCAVTQCPARTCRTCPGPVIVSSEPERGPAVHTRAGQEQGQDGHIAALVDVGLIGEGASDEAGARS